MRKLISSLLIVAILGVLMSLPAKTIAYAPVPVIVVPPVDPVTIAINIIVNVVGALLAIFGFGGSGCDDSLNKFLSTPGIDSVRGGNRNFGGKIQKKMDCPCKANGIVGKVIAIGSPKGAFVGITSKSKVYDNKSLSIGNWVLGKTTARKVCDVPEAYEVDFIGTSK